MTEYEIIAQFQTIEDNFNQALASNNVNEISGYISEDWVLLEPQYGIISRDQFLRAIELDELVHTEMKKKIFRAKLYNDIAIVTTRGMNIGILKDKPFNSEQWITNVYKKHNENWVCVMTQEAPVTCK